MRTHYVVTEQAADIANRLRHTVEALANTLDNIRHQATDAARALDNGRTPQLGSLIDVRDLARYDADYTLLVAMAPLVGLTDDDIRAATGPVGSSVYFRDQATNPLRSANIA
jgi:hypothetical protein